MRKHSANPFARSRARAGTRRRGGVLPCAAVWGLSCVAALGEPYVPADDGEVLETLPRLVLAERDALGDLRRQLAIDPGNADLAATVAGRCVRLGKAGAGPRYFGYARAALIPWWEAADAPPAILRLRAKLKETDHDYDAAAADLKLLLEDSPGDVQAWIELSNLYRVQGRYAAASAACDELAKVAGPAAVVYGRVPLQAVTGQAEEAYTLLARALPTAREKFPDTVQWMLTLQAQLALALGHPDEAEKHFREGLENAPGGGYLLRGYGDLLLDHGRNAEALSLLRDHTDDTGVLLRAAIAADRVGEKTQAQAWADQLRDRFAEIRLRGGTPHGRYESRFVLELENDPPRALRLALANWAQQKEARDTRNVLEAALAAGDGAAATPVIEFLDKHGTQDATLQRLAAQVRRP